LSSWLVEPRRRGEQALHEVAAECFVRGVSTRKGRGRGGWKVPARTSLWPGARSPRPHELARRRSPHRPASIGRLVRSSGSKLRPPRAAGTL